MHEHALKPIRKIVHALLIGATVATFNDVIITTAYAEAAASTKKTYHIAAGPLAKVLSQFAAEAGILLSANAALADGQNSQGLNGNYTVDEGFAILLADTELLASQHSSGSYTILRKPAEVSHGSPDILPEVAVQAERVTANTNAYAGGMIARKNRLGMLGDVDVKDAPFSVTGFTAEAIANRQANTVADMVARDPSVRSTAPSGDVADAFFVRGFPIGDNNIGEIAFDGLFGVAPNYRLMTDYAERIEVLKGPAAMLYGMSPNSGIGGSINVVPKRAGDDLSRVRLGYTSGGQPNGAVDISRRLGDARQFGVRFNGSHRDGDTPIDHQSQRATLGALALDYQGERLHATLDLIDQVEKVEGPSRRPFLSAGLAAPRAPDNRNNISQRWEWYDSHEQSALLRGEYDLHEQLSVFASYGVAHSTVDRLFNTPVISNAAGDTSVTPTRAEFDVDRSSAEAGVRGKFTTGAVKHQVTMQWSHYEDRFDQGTVAGQSYTSNIYSPITRAAQQVAAPASVPKRSTNTLGGVAISDTLSMLDERVQLMLGLRRQQVQSENFNPVTGAKTSDYDQHAVTPMVGLVVKPWQSVSFYGNYIEGLSKGDIAPAGTTNAGEAFSPYKAKQQEVGVKIDHGRLMTTLSLFQIERPSAQTTNSVFSVNGEQRNRGIELSAYGTVEDGLRMYGGATFIDAELTDTNSALTKGNTAVGVPKVQLSLNGEWDVPLLTGFTLTGGIFHSGKQYVNQANTQRLPSWTTLDIGARYRSFIGGKPVTLRADLRNVADKDYWAGASTYGTLSLGAPRTLLLSATVDF